MMHLDPPPLRASEVHVWSLDLRALQDEPDAAATVLSADERARAQRLVHLEDRGRFMKTRLFLRRMLAAYAGHSPAQLTFSYSTKGKPSLENPATDLQFSVSHSDHRALIAVAHARRIGVDIEAIRESVEIFNLAQRYFSASESHRLLAIPSHQAREAFFRIWTAKESFIKASGAGLSRELDSFDIDLDESLNPSVKATRPDPDEVRRWEVRPLVVPEGYAAALATEGAADEPKLLHLP